MAQYLEDAWREGRTRFATFDEFVRGSETTSPRGDLDYATELYSGWILLCYAALESSLVGFGRAAMAIVKDAVTGPDELPDAIRKAHLDRTLTLANELAGVTVPRRKREVTAEELLRQAYTADWAKHSILMRFDRNAWPDNVREWLDRVGADHGRLRWLREPFAGGSETLESLVAKLVEERNDLAHGVRPVTLQTADKMCAWSAAMLEFSRKTAGVLQVTLAESLPQVMPGPLGDMDPTPPKLGPNTVAMLQMRARVAVGDHVLCRKPEGQVVRARVASMQCNAEELSEVGPEAQRVAITFNRPVAQLEFFIAL